MATTRRPDPKDPVPPLGLLAGGVLFGMVTGSIPIGVLLGLAGAAVWKRWAKEENAKESKGNRP
jgi:hypothetical protein